MPNTVDVLVLDLLEWLINRRRSYEETMDAWRTSCPKLQVWEEAVERGFVSVDKGHGESAVRVTPEGWGFLGKFRPSVLDRRPPGLSASDAQRRQSEPD
jgi:hypothetical protein